MIVRNRMAVAAAVVALAAATFLTLAASVGPAQPPKDPLAAELEHWSAFLKSNPATDETWAQVKTESIPIVERAEQALRDGRRLLALERLAVVRVNLAASEYLGRLTTAQRSDMAALEAEWKRMGHALGEAGAVPARSALAGAFSALARAEGEAALFQVHVFYASSLDYGHATMPDAGLFYLGAAEAQEQFASFCRTLPAGAKRPAPPVRSIRAEIDGLNRELLGAYGPPASIERHSEFIVASSLLKEARELDAAGLEYGALLRYLEAALRVASLRTAPHAANAGDPAERLRAFEKRLAGSGRDQSIGLMFLESAEADIAAAKAGTVPAVAEAIADEVLPRYFAAIEPAPPTPPKVAPEVTVTLVRWPYT
jgi:hypothetical protein